MAKSVIKGNEELNAEKTTTTKTKESHDSKLIDPDIYAPLPKEYEESFKSVSMNKSGIAWVNKTGTGTKWKYEKKDTQASAASRPGTSAQQHSPEDQAH